MKIQYDGKEFKVVSSEYFNTYELETPYGSIRYFADHETSFSIDSFIKSGTTEMKFYKNCIPYVTYLKENISNGRMGKDKNWFHNDEIHIYNFVKGRIDIRFASNKASSRDMYLEERNNFMEYVYDKLMKDVESMEHKKITKETNLMIKHLLTKKGLFRLETPDDKEDDNEADDFRIFLSNNLIEDVTNLEHRKLTKETNVMLKHLLTKKSEIEEISELLKDLKLE